MRFREPRGRDVLRKLRAGPEGRAELFSSDYPHMEGGRDPLGRFDRSLEGFDDAVKAKFFHENFERVFPA